MNGNLKSASFRVCIGIMALAAVLAIACSRDVEVPPSPTPVNVQAIVQEALDSQPPSMTEADVAQAVQQAMTAQPGVTEAQVSDAIASALAERPGVTEGDVQEAVESAVARTLAAADSTTLEPDVPLIPRQVLFGNPERLGSNSATTDVSSAMWPRWRGCSMFGSGRPMTPPRPNRLHRTPAVGFVPTVGPTPTAISFIPKTGTATRTIVCTASM